MKKFSVSTKALVLGAMLIALHVVLSRFLSINLWSNKIGFSFVPVMAAACLYGPWAAGAVAAIGDFLGALLFPSGPYFPGFTLTCFLGGVVFGLLLHRRQGELRVLWAVLIDQLLLGLALNTVWLCVLYDTTYGALLLPRVFQCALLIPVEFVAGVLLRRALLHVKMAVRA